MDSLISTFHIDWKIMIAQLINFVVVMIVLWLFALKPLKKLMDERGKTIAGGLENAEKQKELVAQATADYEGMMAKANADAMAKMKQVIKDGEVKRAELLEKAQADVVATIAAGKAQLESEKAKMMEDAKKEFVALVTSATEKVLGSVVTDKIESKIVEESIKQI